MKRFAFWFVAALVAVSMIRSGRHDRHHPEPRVVVIHERDGHVTRTVMGSPFAGFDEEVRRAADEAKDAAREAVEEAREAAREAADEAREAAREAAEAVREAADDVRESSRAFVEGIPVPVVPGTRVTDARPEPPAPPAPPEPPKHRRGARVRIAKAPAPPKPPAEPEPPAEPIAVTGRLSATEPRAKADARLKLIETVRERLEGRVPASWPIPDRFIDGLVREIKVSTVEKDYGTMYEAKLQVDASPRRLDEIASAYRREARLKRLAALGGGLAFLLIGLGTFSGYVRADEATKGYYTNRLRLASLAALGASGVALYRYLS